MVLGRGAAEVLPAGLFPLAVFEVGLPPLWRWQSLAGPYVLWDICLVPVRVSPLHLLRYAGSF